jgi:AbrB family looped-hinge helix DNA binding protein
MTIAKSVRLGKKGQFVIPKERREGLQVKEGDTLLIRLDGRLSDK